MHVESKSKMTSCYDINIRQIKEGFKTKLEDFDYNGTLFYKTRIQLLQEG